MNYKQRRIFLCLFTILFSCNKEGDVEITHIRPTRLIDGFSVSTHISQNILEIETAFNSYFVPDGNASKIYRMDSLLNLAEVIGKPGRGPGEFIGSMTLSFSSNGMYVCDNEATKRFERKADCWEYTGMSWFPPMTAVNESNPVLVHDSIIYFASPLDHWVTMYSLSDMRKVDAFGKLFDLQPKIDRNIMQLLDFNNSLYVIGVGEAVIYRYGYDGKLISFKDLREEAFFSETTAMQNAVYNKDPSNGLSTIFQAAAVINNKIHIIFFHRTKSGNQFNKVLVVYPESYELTKIYELEKEGVYTCISPSLTSKNGFITFNVITAGIELYDLD